MMIGIGNLMQSALNKSGHSLLDWKKLPRKKGKTSHRVKVLKARVKGQRASPPLFLMLRFLLRLGVL